MMAENNEANRSILANQVVENADWDSMVEMAVNGCIALYEKDDAAFQEDWQTTFGG